jgi:predicted alpha/beta hydrolase family esterase
MTAAAIGGTAVIVVVAIAAYAFGSFLLMGKHVSAREIGASLRELVRELWVAGWTQPLLPLFYLVGYRMDTFFLRRGREGIAKAKSEAKAEARAAEMVEAKADALAITTSEAVGHDGNVPVVFVHGYMQNRVGFLGLARALAKQGVGPLFGFNYPWFASMPSNAARLDRFVDRICAETGSAAVDLVCHSMGGLVAMEMMRDEARHAKLKVRRCVTIATPHAGVMWRGPLIGIGATSLRRGSKLLEVQAGVKLAVPCLSVYSSHDNVVHPKESSSLALRGGRDVEVVGLAHLAILFSPKVAEHVAAFLAEPDPV